MLDSSKAPRTIAALALLATLARCSSEKSDAVTDDGALLGLDGPVFDEGAMSGAGSAEGAPSALFAGQACAGQTAGAESAPSVLQLLVDTSGSMNEDAPNARGSKWAATRRALLEAVDEMPDDTSVGVVFYPNVPNNAMPCFEAEAAVAIGQLDAGRQRQQIRQAFGAQNPRGGTPTHDAYRFALEDLSATTALGNRFMVLITDGVPTYLLGCNGTGMQQDAVDSTPLIEEAAAAAARGIRTFVIGSPGSEEGRESLSRMAEAGGTARPGCSHAGPNFCHFDMTREQDLAAGLTATLGIISGVALSCNYTIPAPPTGAILDPSKVNVLYTPPGGSEELILQDQPGACSEGWQYNQDQTQIRLCGNTCDRIRDSEGTLTLQFGCSTLLR